MSEFYGITIAMYHGDDGPPHFHATYGEYKAVFECHPVQLLHGRLPARLRRLVRRWTSAHQDELLRNWERVQNDDPPARIDPLP